MHWYLWVGIGILVGLSARYVMAGNAYGAVVDTLLGAIGAFLASLIVRVPNIDLRISWAGKSSLIIWCAASLPLLARMVAKHRTARTMSAAPGGAPDRFAYVEKKTPPKASRSLSI